MIPRALCGLLLAATPALSAGQSITVEWEYTAPSEPAVTGFRLYRDGTAVCDLPGPDARRGQCEVAPGTAIYTLSATLADGSESDQSAPYIYPVGSVRAPVLIDIDIIKQ